MFCIAKALHSNEFLHRERKCNGNAYQRKSTAKLVLHGEGMVEQCHGMGKK
jgi:hypothetical protein